MYCKGKEINETAEMKMPSKKNMESKLKLSTSRSIFTSAHTNVVPNLKLSNYSQEYSNIELIIIEINEEEKPRRVICTKQHEFKRHLVTLHIRYVKKQNH